MEVEKIETVSIREMVFQKLRMSIVNGELKPGEKLIEADLANRLGVSRTPIREALHKLELEGLVEVYPRKYCMVKGITYACVEEINLIRSLLEPAAARRAVEHLTDEDHAVLEQLLEASERCFERGDIARLMEVHDQFHQSILRASRATWLIRILENLHDYIVRFRRSFLEKPELVQRSIQEHRRILEAIKQRDADRVEALYREHLTGISDYASVALAEEEHPMQERR